jgi:hypothetical protein
MVTCNQMFNNCRPFALCVFTVFLFAIGTSQAQTKMPARPKPKTTPSRPVPIERVNFLVRIDAKKTVSISSVDTGLERKDLAVSGVAEVLRTELAAKRKPGVTVEPTILVMPDASLDIATLEKVIGLLQVSKDTELKVDLPNGPMLEVRQHAKFRKPTNIKPNPFTLYAEVDEKGEVSVNGEPHGNATNTAPLTAFLTEIFKERAENGGFREGTNDVETTIFLKLHPTKKVTDLQKFATALDLGGASPIILGEGFPPVLVIEEIR